MGQGSSLTPRRAMGAMSALCMVWMASCQSSTPPPAPAPIPKAEPTTSAAEKRETPGKYEPGEVTVFHLHKFMNRVGTERDTYTKMGGGEVEAKASFAFQDRGTTVPLTGSVLLAPDGAPRSYRAWGGVARGVWTDEAVVRDPGGFTITRLGEKPTVVQASAPFAMASGYAPILMQDLLLRGWGRAGRPAKVALVPEGTASIESRGKETFDLEGKKVTLEHVSVRDLVWGREDAWLDDAGKLAAVMTRDAEFDLFEAVREDVIGLLPAFLTRAGADGVAWLGEAAKGAVIPREGRIVALVGAQLVDGTGRPPVKDAVVVYDGEKILAAGPRASTKVPDGAVTVDVSGKTVLPGLWDMHAHYEQVEWSAAYLAAGVTTVRDMGNVLEFITGARDAIASGKGVGPQIIVDGLIDGEGPRSLGVLRIKSAEDIVPMLDRLQKAGCPEVKIYSSMPPALVKPIAVEAHRRGLRVVGHVPEGMDVVQALEAGYDGISHVSYAFSSLYKPGEMRNLSPAARLGRIADADVSGPALQKVIRTFAAKKAFLDDTAVLFELGNHTREVLAQREPGLAKLPRELAVMRIEGPSDELAPLRARYFEKYVAILRELHRAGVPIVAGTDQAVPGHSLHRELELYVQAGFTPMEAIQAATSVPAKVMHLDGQVGTIVPGKRADILVVAGDPLRDIHDIRKIATVIARGRTYDPAALWKLVGFAP
ncbi:amidohydrolase family protein [Pendulispora rubella]|uniref:Amidohydrolase family protein n=1 Tax=Pendulispora rubella TaxID=2741070 RepID=A0ABZ2LCV4_9BACT